MRSETQVWTEEGRLGVVRARVLMLTVPLKAPNTGKELGYIIKGNKGSTRQHLEIMHTLVSGQACFFAPSFPQ